MSAELPPISQTLQVLSQPDLSPPSKGPHLSSVRKIQLVVLALVFLGIGIAGISCYSLLPSVAAYSLGGVGMGLFFITSVVVYRWERSSQQKSDASSQSRDATSKKTSSPPSQHQASTSTQHTSQSAPLPIGPAPQDPCQLVSWYAQGISTDSNQSTLLIEFCPFQRALEAAKGHIRGRLNSDSTDYSRAILYGLALGDSRGAPFEFMVWNHNGYSSNQALKRFHLKEGQWTDDSSMAFCVADALILSGDQVDGGLLMQLFLLWWYRGYNNAFRRDNPQRTSVGLGGNIHEAFEKYIQEQQAFVNNPDFATTAGNQGTSGNGSIMRLGPVAIAAPNEEWARQVGRKQSKVTHQGEEAALCCEFMASLLYHMIQYPSERSRKLEFFQWVTRYTTDVQEPRLRALLTSAIYGKEDWNWKSVSWRYDQERLKANPGYIGSFAYDALAMALHTIYHTDSFGRAVELAACRGGDADTVAAVVGQLAGSIYGMAGIPLEWIQKVERWDDGGIQARVHLLRNHARRRFVMAE